MKRLAIDLPKDFASNEAASFVAQLDNLSERMTRDLQTLTADELSRQLAPGSNTIGMLLMHNAICEVYWIKKILCESLDADAALKEVLQIEPDSDGMPLASEGTPPIALTQPYPYFANILQTARDFTTSICKTITDQDMIKEVAMEGSLGEMLCTPRWTLYHILEHQAGHYGQMLLLKGRMKAVTVEE
jgi:uncharacterized damage-inducible protein DinB